MRFLRNLFKALFLTGLILATVVGAITLYGLYDKRYNYTPVTATITDIQLLCHLERKRRGFRRVRRTIRTKKDNCEKVKEEKRTNSKFERYRLKQTQNYFVAYQYEGADHQGRLSYKLGKEPFGMKKGQTMPILVKKDNPKKIQKP